MSAPRSKGVLALHGSMSVPLTGGLPFNSIVGYCQLLIERCVIYLRAVCCISREHCTVSVTQTSASIQKRAAHFVMNDYVQTSSVSNMLVILDWNMMESHFKFLRLQLLHKIIYNHVDITLPSYVTYTVKSGE